MEKKVKQLQDIISSFLKEKEFVLIAIDGRCTSGKTSLASLLAKDEEVTVVHMDDFFLREKQRSLERRNTPGENVDHERFLKEVLIPMSKRETFVYTPYDCKTGKLKEGIRIHPTSICIVEGSYSCHKNLWDYYDLHVFMDVDKNTQIERIQNRDKTKLEAFMNLWIPLEEKYFETYQIKEKCEIVL